jgi:secondary thiamine-phosphate synthase enzyme
MGVYWKIYFRVKKERGISMPLYEYSIATGKEGFYNITENVREAVRQSGISEGLCVVCCVHTSAGITINENADPGVIYDLLMGFQRAFPDGREFRHMEGKSSAHIKSSCVGASVSLIVHEGQPLLGVFQGVYFCEFEGPRSRKYVIKVIEG